ncbi:hypothetical protein ACLIBH_03660 [Virgibacillus sp. W0430]|uniref:hypothetical protein n=1 Tax=Virgibacillus sp. W0430 TaxID=3391580 RepID=UPI003F46F936
MSKVFRFSVLILLVFLAACNSISKYEDSEVIAIVKGHKITVGDLRFLYPDDTALDYLDGVIQIELVKHEVEEMKLDISDKENDTSASFEELPPKNTTDADEKQIRTYAESQAKKLGIKPEQFQREYARKINEQNAYLKTYLEEKLGEGNFSNAKWMVEFDELLEELVKENEAEIEVLIK